MSTRQQSPSGSVAWKQYPYPRLFSLLFILLVSGCGGGSGDNLSIASFGGNPGSGCSTTIQNQSCTAPNTGDSSTANTVLLDSNYQFVANRIAYQVDGLLRQRSGMPPTLADLAASLLQKVDQNSTHVCSGAMGIPDPITINNTGTNSFTLTITDCQMLAGSTTFPLNGTMNVSNFSVDSVAPWTVSADLTISLTYAVSVDQDLAFDGNLGFSTQYDTNNNLVSTINADNLRITEQTAGVGGVGSTSIIDTFTSGTLTKTTDTTNMKETLDITASYDNTSVTQATLSITASSLVWLLGSDNPDATAGGSLQVTDSGGSSLVMTPVDATRMDISLNGAAAVCTGWTELTPPSC